MTSLSSAMALVRADALDFGDWQNKHVLCNRNTFLFAFSKCLLIWFCALGLNFGAQIQIDKDFLQWIVCMLPTLHRKFWFHLLLATVLTHPPYSSAPSWRKSVFCSAARSLKQRCRLNNDERLLPSDCFMNLLKVNGRSFCLTKLFAHNFEWETIGLFQVTDWKAETSPLCLWCGGIELNTS